MYTIVGGFAGMAIAVAILWVLYEIQWRSEFREGMPPDMHWYLARWVALLIAASGISYGLFSYF